MCVFQTVRLDLRAAWPPMAPAQTFIGTVIYMSPERLRGDEYGATADIWSFGLVLLQAATGQHPFKGMAHPGAGLPSLSPRQGPLLA